MRGIKSLTTLLTNCQIFMQTYFIAILFIIMISASSDSEEEFFSNAIMFVPRPRHFRNRVKLFEVYSDSEFKIRFRFSKDTVLLILNRIGDRLTSVTYRNQPIDPTTQLLIAFRFYATGTFQAVLGDTVNISVASVSRIISRVTHILAQMKRAFVQMPSREDIPNVKKGFYLIAQLPGIIGALDCTHIRLQSPGGDHAETFRNRKKYFSINVQAICDADLNFLNIIARWPGSVHDSTIFNDCPLKHELEAGFYPNCSLLGDSGYGCSNYLLTPLLNPRTAAEEEYNRRHILTRNTIERAFGVLKRRFPCLSTGLRLKMETTLAVIVACFTLHNIAKLAKDEVPPEDINVILPVNAYEPVPVDAVANGHTAARTAIINAIQME